MEEKRGRERWKREEREGRIDERGEGWKRGRKGCRGEEREGRIEERERREGGRDGQREENKMDKERRKRHLA